MVRPNTDGDRFMEHGRLQHARDWKITRDATVLLSDRLGQAFTYGELHKSKEMRITLAGELSY